MTTVHLIYRHDRPYAVTSTKEDAEILSARLAASGNGSEYDIQEFQVVSGDLQPRHLYSIDANITDAQEVFVRNEEASIVWPVRKMEFPDAEWEWDRYPLEKFGRLRVAGYDESKVKELFKAVAEMFRLDEKMFQNQRLRG